MNITYDKGISGPTMRMGDIPDGTTFMGRVGHYPSRLFLMAGGGCPVLVSLDFPNHTWSGYPNLEIEDYREVSITVNVRG